MKNKNLVLVFVSMFALLLLAGFTSATLGVSPSSLTFNNNNSQTITVSSNISSDISYSDFTINGVTFAVSGNTTLDSNNETVLTVTPQVNLRDFDFLKSYTSTFDITQSGSETLSYSVTAQNTNLCKYENYGGDLDIEIRDIQIKEGIGDDEEWFPLDQIEIEVRIENNGDEDLRDVELEWGIYDSSSNEWIIEIDDVDSFKIKDGDDETVTISFTLDDHDLDIDLEDLEDGSYELYARATGEVDIDSKPNTCDFTSESVDIIIERDFAVLDDLKLPENLQCGSDMIISGDVWNIGDRDQDDIEVKVVESRLGIEKYVSVGDIDALNSESFSLTIPIPEDASGTYNFKFSVLDEDGDIYEADHDDELSTFSQSVTISGECSSSTDAEVHAVLQDGGQAGKPLTVKATLINSGEKTTTYTLNVAGYGSWADGADLTKTTLTLDAGESEDVLITLDVKSDAFGEEIFNIEVISSGALIANQPVSVEVSKKSLITGFAISGSNWHLWGIGLLNLILVIVIIIIAVRVARK